MTHVWSHQEVGTSSPNDAKWVRTEMPSPLREVCLGVCFGGMFRGMFRGVFRGVFRDMFRGMFRCILGTRIAAHAPHWQVTTRPTKGCSDRVLHTMKSLRIILIGATNPSTRPRCKVQARESQPGGLATLGEHQAQRTQPRPPENDKHANEL